MEKAIVEAAAELNQLETKKKQRSKRFASIKGEVDSHGQS